MDGPSARSRWQSIGGCVRRDSSAPPSIRSSPAGPNAALPHAHPGERTLTEDDLVVLDFGGVYDSYCVDLTRTVSVGRAGARAREVYAAVLAAHDAAIRGGPARASRFAIDAAARDELTRSRTRARRSATAPAMASASRFTKLRGSLEDGRASISMMIRSKLGWFSRLSRERTCQVGAASGSKTTSSSRRRGRAC